MADIRFYHLQTQTLEQALPALLQKAYGGGHRILVKLKDENEVDRLNDYLWRFSPNVFLPHGAQKDGDAAYHPIYLTDRDENPNGATVLILSQGAQMDSLEGYAMCCEMFDGRSGEQVQAARTRWKAYKEAGHEVTYWKQKENGGWEKKA